MSIIHLYGNINIQGVEVYADTKQNKVFIEDSMTSESFTDTPETRKEQVKRAKLLYKEWKGQ